MKTLEELTNITWQLIKAVEELKNENLKLKARVSNLETKLLAVSERPATTLRKAYPFLEKK